MSSPGAEIASSKVIANSPVSFISGSDRSIRRR